MKQLTQEDIAKQEASERYYTQLAKDQELCLQIYAMLEQTCNARLADGQYGALLELIPLVDDSERKYAFFHPSGDTRKLYILLCGLKLDLSYGAPVLLAAASDYHALLELYVKIIFSIRRLELSLPEDACREAADFLRSLPLSVYTAFLIVRNENFEREAKICRALSDCFSGIWTEADQELWRSFFAPPG